jgi:hypothetical protein
MDLLSLGYLILNLNIEFGSKLMAQEVLKQLITFTVLIVSLIYAILVPRLFYEKEKRSALIVDYKKDCFKLFSVQQMFFNVSSLIFEESDREWNIRDIYKLYYGSTPPILSGNRFPHISKEFYLKIESIIFLEEQPKDYNDAKLYHYFRYFLKDKIDKRIFLLKIFLREFSNPTGKSMRMYETAPEVVFSPLELEYIIFSIKKINSYYHISNERPTRMDTNLETLDIRRKYSLDMINKFRAIALQGIALSDDLSFGYGFVYDTIFRYITFIYIPRIEKMSTDLSTIIKRLNNDKYKPLVNSSFFAVLFGCVSPMLLLQFDLEMNAQLFTTYLVEICVSILLSFVFDIYNLFNDDSDNLSFEN